MITYKCDGCGRELKKHALRYTVKIDVRAAYDELEIGLVDLLRDHQAEMLALIEKLKQKDPKEIEETIYKGMRFDLCPSCQKPYIQDPIHFHPGQAVPDEDLDMDDFLRSLGFGVSDDEEKDEKET